MKPEEIRVQISSLNDELKNTNKLVELKHSERDLLLKEIEELKEEKKKEEESLQKVKDSQAGIQSSHEQQIKLLREQIDTKLLEGDTLTSRIKVLEIKESQLIEKIKGYKDDKKKLGEVRKELEEAEKNKPLIEAVKKETLEAIDQLNEAKIDLDVAVRERERTQNFIKIERDEHLDWIAEQKTKITEKDRNVDLLKLDYEKKHKDLRIIRARLKKTWPKDKPFPKLDW